MTEIEKLQSVEGMIHKIVYGFVRTYPFLDEQELLGEAMVAAVSAVKSYDPEQSKLTTWVTICVTNYLRGLLRNQCGRRRMSKGGCDRDIGSLPDKSTFELEFFLAQLSPEAQEAVLIALQNKSRTKLSIVRKIRKYFGFEVEVLNKVWDEIREAICD